MPDTDDVALWYALYRLVTNYWFEVDFNGGGGAPFGSAPGGVEQVQAPFDYRSPDR